MKVLNAYSGLGGNRKLWEDVEVTAVEKEPDIAEYYQDKFPNDTVIVGDAHKYIINNFQEFDFIWVSNPCPTHSRARFFGWKNINPVYPDFSLYEEIVFLKHHAECKWVCENVVPYYDPLIPGKKIGRHMFWSNFKIGNPPVKDADIHRGLRDEWSKFHGIDISGYSFNTRTDKLLRNCVHPEIGEHILNRARGIIQKSNTKQMQLL